MTPPSPEAILPSEVLLGTIKAIPVLYEHGGDCGESVLPTGKGGISLAVAGNPGGLEKRVDGVEHAVKLSMSSRHADQTFRTVRSDVRHEAAAAQHGSSR